MASKFRSYSCQVTPSTPTAAVFFRLKKASVRQSSLTRSTPLVTCHNAEWKPNRISRGSATEVSTHAQGLRLRRVSRRLAISAAVRVAFPLSGQGRHAKVVRRGAEYLACLYPLPMPHPRCYHRRRRVWGRAVGWTLLVRLSHSLLQSGLSGRFP